MKILIKLITPVVLIAILIPNLSACTENPSLAGNSSPNQSTSTAIATTKPALASASTIDTTYTVGTNPMGICFDGTNIWVVNSGSNNVTKLSASNGTTLGTYTVGTEPRDICFDGTNIWVTNFSSNSVTKLRASDGNTMSTYTEGTEPMTICFDGTNIWVTNGGSNIVLGNVAKLQVSDSTILGYHSVGTQPEGICYDGTNIWVTNFGSNNITKLPVLTITLSATPALASSPASTSTLASSPTLTSTKVAHLNWAVIPAGYYVSDDHKTSRTLTVKGTTIIMNCQSVSCVEVSWPQLGTHTYEYKVQTGANLSEPVSLDEANYINLTDVVNGSTYGMGFKYLSDYNIIMITDETGNYESFSKNP